MRRCKVELPASGRKIDHETHSEYLLDSPPDQMDRGENGISPPNGRRQESVAAG